MPLPQAFLEWEQQVRDEGRDEGKKEGKKEGIKEGKKEGIRTVALNLMRTGMSLSQVAEVTGLSLEEVQKLQNNQNGSN